MRPFAKWPGRKTQLLETLKARMPGTYGRYYEPFIGSGALLLDIQPERAVINDINEPLLNVYNQLRTDADAVISAVNKLDAEPCDNGRYMALRKIYNDKIKADEFDIDCAALMIWINKHCFNGLYRVNSKGMFNVAFNNKENGVSIDEQNIRSIGLYLCDNDIEIRNLDFEQACSDVKAGDFIYFDPPYLPVSETANFTHYNKEGFSLDDQKRLAALCRRLTEQGIKIMLSNNNVPLVYDLYKGFNIENIDVRRSINRDASKRTGKEVIITNY
ncbi:MAG: DNA adenine methylase [Clostridia bacterium]|nr:DNA adenine methylase [Clostridia bacterium]